MYACKNSSVRFSGSPQTGIPSFAPASFGLKLGLKPPIGTRDMDSTPPTTIRSPLPSMIVCAAKLNAVRLLAQKRFTVTPPAVVGRPASAVMMRATFMPCSPSGKAQPTITSSICEVSTFGTRSSAPRTAVAAKSSARMLFNTPLPARPIGVRTALTITASGILCLLYHRAKVQHDGHEVQHGGNEGKDRK